MIFIPKDNILIYFKVRQKNGNDFLYGSWINRDGTKKSFNSSKIQLEETAYSIVNGKQIPTKWKISLIFLQLCPKDTPKPCPKKQ